MNNTGSHQTALVMREDNSTTANFHWDAIQIPTVTWGNHTKENKILKLESGVEKNTVSPPIGEYYIENRFSDILQYVFEYHPSNHGWWVFKANVVNKNLMELISLLPGTKSFNKDTWLLTTLGITPGPWDEYCGI